MLLWRAIVRFADPLIYDEDTEFHLSSSMYGVRLQGLQLRFDSELLLQLSHQSVLNGL